MKFAQVAEFAPGQIFVGGVDKIVGLAQLPSLATLQRTDLPQQGLDPGIAFLLRSFLEQPADAFLEFCGRTEGGDFIRGPLLHQVLGQSLHLGIEVVEDGRIQDLPRYQILLELRHLLRKVLFVGGHPLQHPAHPGVFALAGQAPEAFFTYRFDLAGKFENVHTPAPCFERKIKNSRNQPLVLHFNLIPAAVRCQGTAPVRQKVPLWVKMGAYVACQGPAMLLEMHCHSLEHSPCSHVRAVDLVLHCFAKGLQGIVLTDHHYLWSPAELKGLRREARVPDHFLILSGQETRTADYGDVLVYGAGATLPRDLSLAELRLAAPRAALVWAHPYRKSRRPTAGHLSDPAWDGIEIFNSNHTVRGNSRGLRDWHRLRFTAIAGTDTHGGSYAGLYPTLFDHPVTEIAELAQELRAGRCRPFYKEIPHAGSKNQVTEVTFGAKGQDEVRERIIIRSLDTDYKWQSAERAHRIMAALSRHGFRGGSYRVPSAIDADPGNRTLIQEGLRGKTLFDRLLAAPTADGRHYLQLAARWLARLHNCRLCLTRPDEFLPRERLRLGHYLERFRAIGHPFTTRAAEIHDAVLAREERLLAGGEPLLQGHGDFHPKNIIIGQDNLEDRGTLFVAAVDFESSLCLPAAFDVGGFLAQFRNQFFAHPEILERYPEADFLAAYHAERPDLQPDFAAQVAIYRARANLSIAAYLIKLGLGGGEDLYRVLLEAEQALAHTGAAELASRAGETVQQGAN